MSFQIFVMCLMWSPSKSMWYTYSAATVFPVGAGEPAVITVGSKNGGGNKGAGNGKK